MDLPKHLAAFLYSFEQKLCHLNHPGQGWLPQGSPLSSKDQT